METSRDWLSKHAARRMAQRNVTSEDLLPVIRFGRLSYAAGAEFYFLGKRDLPENLRLRLQRLVGITVVVRDCKVLTVYRNRHSPGRIRRKLKWLSNNIQLLSSHRADRSNVAG
jgi:hypothetical protein